MPGSIWPQTLFPAAQHPQGQWLPLPCPARDECTALPSQEKLEKWLVRGESLGEGGFEWLFVLDFLTIFLSSFQTGFLSVALGCPGTHSVDQFVLKLSDPPASASSVLGLKAYTTTAWLLPFFFF